MRQLRGTFIELQPAHGAVIFHVLGYFSLGNAQVLSHELFQPAAVSGASAAAQQVANADAQRLARFDVVVRHLVGIGEQEYTRARRGLVGFVQRRLCAG